MSIASFFQSAQETRHQNVEVVLLAIAEVKVSVMEEPRAQGSLKKSRTGSPNDAYRKGYDGIRWPGVPERL